MADTKLSQLTELAVEPADVDEIYISDGGTSKRITYGTLKTALLARANHTGTQTASTISDFDTEVSNNSDVAANTAKVTNATHTGDAAGDGALTLQTAAITGKGAVTVAAGDLLLVADISASPQVLGQVTAQSIANLAPAVQGSAILSSDTSPLITDGYVLTADGAGGAAWEAVAAGTGDLKADGTVPLTANWDVGSFDITAEQFHSDIATGTAPFTVASTTVVTNLNADLLDGNEASAFATAAHNHDSDYISVVGTPTAGNFPQLTAGGELVNSTYDETSFATAAQANATHSGDAVGDGALTLQPAAITGKGAVTVAGGDLLLVTDVSASPQVLGQVTAQSIADLAAPQGTSIRSDGTSPVATDGYVLTADGAGGAAWEAGGGAVDWSTTQTSNLSAATGDEVAFDLSSTVNKAAGNYTGLKLNVTETAAPGTADKLLDLQVGNTSRFYVNNANELVVGPPSGNTSFYIRHQQDTDQCIRIAPDGGGYFTATNNAGADHVRLQNGVYVASGSAFGFSNSATNANPALADIFLVRDAAANLALRNSTTAQTFRAYNTYTDASNYQRLSLGWNTSTALIHNEGAGTGADGSVAFNDAALATTATKGFLMIPSCAGAPTGTPADIPTGQVPIVFDSTNNQLYVYDGGWLATAALT